MRLGARVWIEKVMPRSLQVGTVSCFGPLNSCRLSPHVVLAQIASINTSLKAEAVLPGDLLRAVTATNFVYPTKALFGASAPERHIVSGHLYHVHCYALRLPHIAAGASFTSCRKAPEPVLLARVRYSTNELMHV